MTESKSPKKNKKRMLIVLAVLAVVLLAVYVYKDKIFNAIETKSAQKENSQGAETETPISNQTIIQGAGKVEPIAGVDIKTLKIVSLGEVTDVKEDGGFSASLYKDGVTTVAAMLPDQDFGLLNIVLPDAGGKNDNLELTAETTAVSLIFMTPYIVTPDPDKANKILAVIESDESVKELAAVIKEKVGSTGDIMQDAEYEAAFNKALESVLEKLSQQI